MVQLLGRVGGDPVLRGEQTKFSTFRLATSINYSKTNESGKKGNSHSILLYINIRSTVGERFFW